MCQEEGKGQRNQMLQRGLDREGGNIRPRRWSDSEVIAQRSKIPGSVVAGWGGGGGGAEIMW